MNYDVIQALQTNGYAYAVAGVRPPAKSIFVKSRVKPKKEIKHEKVKCEKKIPLEYLGTAFGAGGSTKQTTKAVDIKAEAKKFREISENQERFVALVQSALSVFKFNAPLGMIRSHLLLTKDNPAFDDYDKKIIKCVFLSIVDGFNRIDMKMVEEVSKNPALILNYYYYGNYIYIEFENSMDDINVFSANVYRYDFMEGYVECVGTHTCNINNHLIDGFIKFYSIEDLMTRIREADEV